MKKVVKLLLIFIIFLLNNTPVFAAPIINEVYPNPAADENEWVEIFNDSDEEIDLSGWVLMDELSSPSIIFSFDQELISSQSYLVIELSVNKLNNSADSVELIDNTGELVDRLQYSNSETQMSFAIITDEDGNKNIALTNPTKGEQNFAENNNENQESSTNNSPDNTDENNDDQSYGSSQQTYSNLLISEVMACPTSGPEWIKVENPNEFSVSLSGWLAKDAANNLISLPTEEFIVPNQSIKISLDSDILNNSGDSVFLFDPNGELVNSFNYNECFAGIPITVNNSQISNSSNNPEENEQSPSNKEGSNQTKNKTSGSLTESSRNRLLKINSYLKSVNTDKSATQKTTDYISNQIIINHKKLPKSATISVIIGGAFISGSGLFFDDKRNL